MLGRRGAPLQIHWWFFLAGWGREAPGHLQDNPHKCREKTASHAKPMAMQPPACRLQERNGGHGGRGTGACRSARCCSLLVAGEAAQHLPPARLKSENYSCSIKADYHPSKPNSIIISMLLLYFCNWKAIIRLPPSLPPSRSLFLIHLQVMLL